MVQALLKAGADPNNAGIHTPRDAVADELRFIWEDAASYLRLLLDHGAPIVRASSTVHASLLHQVVVLASDSLMALRPVLDVVDLLAARGEGWGSIRRPVACLMQRSRGNPELKRALIQHLVMWHGGDPQVRGLS